MPDAPPAHRYGNCYTWALWRRLFHGGRIRWRWSEHGPWPHAAWSPDGEIYWCLVPRRFTQRQWMRTHRRPPICFVGKVVRDFKPSEGMNL